MTVACCISQWDRYKLVTTEAEAEMAKRDVTPKRKPCRGRGSC